MAGHDRLQINPQAFQEAIKGKTEVKNLVAGVLVKTCRAAHIIHYSQTDPEAFDKQYHHLTIDTGMAWPPAPIKLMKEYDFALAKEIAEKFTIVHLANEKEPTVVLQVGHIGKDEIVIAWDGTLLRRIDKSTIKRLTASQAKVHAREIEQAIDFSRLKKLDKILKGGKDRYQKHWFNFEKDEAPCEQAPTKPIKKSMKKIQAATTPVGIPEPEIVPRAATKSETASKNLKTKSQKLQKMVEALSRIARGESWQNIPEVAAYGEPITAQEAAAALGEINGQIAVDLLKSNDSMIALLTQYGFGKEADDIRALRDNVVIPAIAKSLK